MSVEMSEQITELFTALLAFHAEVIQPVKNARNEHFGNTFADLRTVLATVQPTLLRHGLVMTQLPVTAEKGIGLCTQITHAASGQWIRGTVAFPVQQANPQAAASAITYARRYGVMAVLGLAAEDDDGEAAMGRDTRIDRRVVSPRDGSPIVDVVRPAPERAPVDPERRETRSAARAAVRRANAAAGGIRTMEDIAGMGAPAAAPAAAPAPQPAPAARSMASVTPLRKVRPDPSFPNAGRAVANPRVVLAYNETANTIHAMTTVKLTGEIDEYGLLVPPHPAPKFTSGDNRGRAYTEVTIDTLRSMGESRAFLSSAPPLNKLWVAYLVARIDANTRAAQP